MTADDIMREVHRGCRDDMNQGSVYAHGAAYALLRAELLTPESHRLWGMALKTCPGHDDEGGRVWCAYCGDIQQPANGSGGP